MLVEVVDFNLSFSVHDRLVTKEKKLARPGLFPPPVKKKQSFPSCYNQLESWTKHTK